MSFSLNTSQQQQQQPPNQTGSNGFFGGSSTLDQAQQNTNQNGTTPNTGGLFGRTTPASQPTQQPPAGGSSFFAASTQNQPQALQQPQNGMNNPTTAHFRYLVERGNKRKSRGDSSQFGELPSLQLGLGDISGKLRNLGNAGSRPDRATDSRAYVSFPNSGGILLTCSIAAETS